ncbi:hypothetical protein B0T17DRAFT_339062 [Bombardia bombarda]|uniref:Uncharacterized protein n=1 Tax=Bombardia bombarda TaxID=252184 RepID=A0AA40BYE0_9PEZI|nr:hypothetical protein B0T17DRAFT_339062 [Bombardia bombarda]
MAMKTTKANMQQSIPLALLASGHALIARASEGLQEIPGHIARRQQHFMSCEETYGKGSVRCGGEGSPFCYNPYMGQTCCNTDNGYCDEGTYCAPVAGCADVCWSPKHTDVQEHRYNSSRRHRQD